MKLHVLPQSFESLDVLRPVRGCGEKVLGMDVSDGCGAGCIHCTGGLTGERYGAPTRVVPLLDVARQLEEELEQLAGVGQRPERIRLGLHSDPLWPAPEVLSRTRACLQVCFEKGIPVELHTRSLIPDDVAELLKSHPTMVRVVLGVMTVRDSAARVYEAELPPPMGRLKALKPLLAHGVGVTVRVEPLVPLVNDTEADLEALLEAVAKNGVRRVELAYLALTPDTAKSLARGLPRMHREMLKGLFANEPWSEGPYGARKLLPRVLRTAGYDRALTVARRFGLVATICACSEPDLKAKVCNRAAEGSAPAAGTVTPVRVPVPVHVSAAAEQARQGGEQLGLFGGALRRSGGSR